MPNWKVELIAEAHADFNRLDGSVKKQVLKQFVKLERNPKYGAPLGNKAGINLEGYFSSSTLIRSESELFMRRLTISLKLLQLTSGKTWKSIV